MNDEQSKIYDAIDKILWADWDPIGLNDNEAARDEYKGYTFRVFKLKRQGADKERSIY